MKGGLMPHDFRGVLVLSEAAHGVDVRASLARVLWNNGWGRENFSTFETYLDSVPLIPEAPDDIRFNRLVLVDTGLSISIATRILGVAYDGGDSVFDESSPCAAIYWLWVSEGNFTDGEIPFEVVQSDIESMRGLSVIEGLCFFVQYSRLLSNCSWNLTESHLAAFPAYIACLLWIAGVPMLGVTEYCTGGFGRQTPLARRF
ncbi:MAG: hypothetical protein NT003_03035 [Candidatus Magasanikbacteria bacterium]|nr:hypothetical protein [Candidatus Magasanikbacteria bacterium]